MFNFVQDNWNVLEDTISSVGDIINKTFETLVGTLNNVSSFLGGIIEDIGSLLGLGDDESTDSTKHAAGIGYVPYDNYPALLHQGGERVLTANESDQLKRGSNGIVINIPPKLADSINASDALDVDRLLGQLEDRIVNVAMNMGG